MPNFLALIITLTTVYYFSLQSVTVRAEEVYDDSNYSNFQIEDNQSQEYYLKSSKNLKSTYDQKLKADKEAYDKEQARIAEEKRIQEEADAAALFAQQQAQIARNKTKAVYSQPVAVNNPAPEVTYSGGSVESLIAYWTGVYGGDTNYHIKIGRCESGLRPGALGGGLYAGVFQQHLGYWPARAARFGFAGASPYDANANIAVSIAMMRTMGYGHWECA
jgi:hypothetical protein